MKQIEFINKRAIFMPISLICVILTILLIVFQGLNLGLDFVGETLVQISVKQDLSIDEMRKLLSESGIKEFDLQSVITKTTEGKEYIVKDGDTFSHGKTIKEARDSLLYKISNRDTSRYKKYKLNKVLTKKEAIEMYRVITGACEYGVRQFCKGRKIKNKMTIAEIIKITDGQYGNGHLREFFGSR